MAFVNYCPTTMSEIENASKRLGCGRDLYGNDQYICVPNEKKTSLVEFCFDGIMGIVQRDHCQAAAGKTLVENSCVNFTSGCPKHHYWSYDFYKYSECKAIDTKSHCYLMDPACQSNVHDDDTSHHDNITSTFNIYFTVIIVIGFISIFFVLLMTLHHFILKKLFKVKEPVGENECVSPMLEEKKEEIRIVLLGKTGAGKSATGNTILGETLFKSLMSASPVTKNCLQKSCIKHGQRIVIVDTPGMSDYTSSMNEFQEEIQNCIRMTAPGPHAFILVLSPSRFTKEEQNYFDSLSEYFGENMFRFSIILFTHKDKMNGKNVTLKTFLKSSPKVMQMLIDKCDGRTILFNNRLKDDAQVNELLNMIKRNIEENGGNFFTNEMCDITENMPEERLKTKFITVTVEDKVKVTEYADETVSLLMQDLAIEDTEIH